ncbi:MAG: hypothetical protein ACU0C9_08625 [Paracoccaceae bacterium]
MLEVEHSKKLKFKTHMNLGSVDMALFSSIPVFKITWLTQPESVKRGNMKSSQLTLALGTGSAQEVWDQLGNIHQQFVTLSPNFRYDLGLNSISYAATLLWMVGIDVKLYLNSVTPSLVVDGFPGVSQNILTDGHGLIGGPLDIDLILNGTDSDDILNTGIGDANLTSSIGDEQFSAGGPSLFFAAQYPRRRPDFSR